METLPTAPEKVSVDLEVTTLHPKGLAVKARRAFTPGEVIALLDGGELTGPTRFSIRHADKHDETKPPLRYINHSCSPNTHWNGKQMQALQSIAAGEEITFDYLETEDEISAPFICHCGAPHCRGKIGNL